MKTSFLLTLPLAMTATAVQAKAKAPVQRPNIIFILTDDQRWDAMGCAGNPVIQTPAIDGLARNGIYFRNTYATTSISCVSRASIFTGQHQACHGITGFDRHLSPAQLADSYPVQLRNAGYYTAFLGKYGVGDDQGVPKEAYDYFRTFTGQGRYWDSQPGEGDHMTVRQGKQILEFLQARDKDKPFCLSVSFKAPHCQDEERAKGGEEFPAEPRDMQLYQDDFIPYPYTRDDKYYLDFPDWFRYSGAKNKENEARVRWRYRFATDSMYQATTKKYFRLITGVDRQVGLMMEELKKQGLMENTVIIYMADNGYYLAEHGLAGKWFAHEESVRLPLIICDGRTPEKKRGKTVDQLALNIDIAPTILAFAGVEAPAAMQGASLAAFYGGTPKNWRKDYYYEYSFNPKGIHLPECEGIIGGRYKYIRYAADGNEWLTLYDLKNDPYETTNLAPDPAYAEILAELVQRTAQYKRDASGK